MELVLDRKWCRNGYSIGNLYIDGIKFCNTLEDTDRDLNDTMSVDQIKKTKVYGETAIPKGQYTVTLTYSNKFKQIMPLVNNVKGFDGIRIHVGNTAKDSLGCILVGENKAVGKVLNSRATYNKLFNILKAAADKKEAIKLTIK